MTIAPRWRKVLGDLEDAPVRATLAVLSMAAGVFGLSLMLTSYSILDRELATTYAGTHPSSATIVLDSLTDGLVETARRTPGVAAAEARPVLQGRLRVGADEWAPMILFVVRDFEDLRLDTFVPDSGEWPPKPGEVLLERTALTVARAAVGDTVVMRTSQGPETQVRVSGTVHAAGLAPSWMDHVVSGFVSWDSVVRAGGREGSGLRIAVSELPGDLAHIRDVADRVKESLEAAGGHVSRMEFPPPGKHPHADQMAAFLFLLGGFGALTLVLSAGLVATMIHALLAKQIRQVGVMKALGATTGQITGLYLAQVLVLAGLALAAGLPLGYAAGRAYARFSADMLNATLSSLAVPAWTVIVQVAVGTLVPLAVAVIPIHRASRITVHRALGGDEGDRGFGTRIVDRALTRFGWLPRPFLLSLRTTLNRRGRLALTVATLAAGGAVFVAALNVSEAWKRALDLDARSRRFDVSVRLAQATPVESLRDPVLALPGVEAFESWDEGEGALAAGHRISLVGPDPASKILHLPLIDGRWLEAGEEGVAVINNAVLALDPALGVGRPLTLRVKGKALSLTIVGVVKEMSPAPVAYAPPGTILAATGQAAGMARTLRVVTRRHDVAGQLEAKQELDRLFEREKIGVDDIQPLADRRKAFEDHLVIIQSALLLASALVLNVGALGLASTLGLSVSERTREIGVMSAIGATPGTISRHVVAEGLIIGILAWAVALVAAVPVSWLFDSMTGQIFIKAPLDFAMSPRAAGIWLALVVVLAAAGSAFPARRASRLAVREALAYE
ncbi:MAG: ABC transporter permease [Acidobacteria bacterium]|nr:ABC transporter permease [Acidobacteriota bacterium]